MTSVYSDNPPIRCDKLELEYRPSASERWFKCPGSVWVSAVLPELPTSIYAEEGTAAHWLYRNYVLNSFHGSGSTAENGVLVTEEMCDVIHAAARHTKESLQYMVGAQWAKHTYLEHEVRWVGKNENSISGTADLVCATDNVTIVVDLKYGAGKYVNHINNSQLLIYAAAVRQMFGESSVYYVGILQPRFAGGSSKNIRWSILDNIKLDAFEKNLNSAIDRTKIFPSSFTTGDHCFFCPGKTLCPAVCSDNLYALMVHGKQVSTVYNDPINLWALDHKKVINSNLSSLEKETEEFAKSGGFVNGYQLEKYDGRIQWKKDPNLLYTLEREAERLGLKSEAVKKVNPIGIREAEKLGIRVSELTENPKKQRLVKVEKVDSMKGFF